ncbi:2-succinyl-5-enolpyruvyl-6-hydroxy-3-cyclohexene-1-carboxylic-acid synthase [Motilibacter aurantiacus]|uniref:2-succinyl-5-enolpyruvyl-6-hydroxy-3- cyclohexene-1-carboxylic-acid synthase n=1 Tax=Motilibacter aurantiacus TaxID=2714955 RepID=UPI0018C8A748|nr:2-succinyl-5-enolpyruvyl-6-hydroxy-3-cyclohexene-1-carboxylic-acid synthase [Motilibacter aurantiacus]
MTPAEALATVLVDELVRGGVQEAVLSPGSRSAPLAYALHAAEARGLLRLHVRIDERTAGFLALGLAKASGLPVPVVTTSGTATANLHPAVLEASYSSVPVLALTADRPVEMRGVGANQTLVDQRSVYGSAVRESFVVPAPDSRTGQVRWWRALTARALATSCGRLDEDPGPVHIDVAFREPLVPSGADDWVEPLDGRPDGAPWAAVGRATGAVPPYAGAPRTLVLVGDCAPALAQGALRLAGERDWPIVAEPSAGLGNAALPSLLLAAEDFVRVNRPERVLLVGRPTLSRAVTELLRTPGVAVDVVAGSPRWPDPATTAETVLPPALLTGPAFAVHPEWSFIADDPVKGEEGFAEAWRVAGESVANAVSAVLRKEPWPSGFHIAQAVAGNVPGDGLLVVGSSNPVRDLDNVGSWVLQPARVLANRGVSGIDGTVSTAIGAALGHQRAGGGPAYALMGDLTFLHDATALVIGKGEPLPGLTIVVVNDDGGGIFGLLEQGAPELSVPFERVFGTPHGVDLRALCSATSTPYVRARSADELELALEPGLGIRVVEVRVDRQATPGVHDRLHAAVDAVLG